MLYNTIYSSGLYPQQWATGIIVPIFKKGDRKLPANYRAITLTSNISKMFTYLLNRRLCEWLELNDLLSRSQYAYRKGYSTTDAVFVLNSVITQSLASTSGVYCAFIDFTKAFDSISRTILYRKLIRIGVSSQMLTVLINMYSKIRSKIRTTEGNTDYIDLTIGLMQGECLSPTLFSLYIDDIDEIMNTVASIGIEIGNEKFTVLKYADDLVLLSNCKIGIQNGLNALKNYCDENKLTVNIAKSKLMCFSKGSKRNLPDITYDGHSLEWVKSFKYLGITFKQTNTFTHAQKILCEQARRAQTVLDLHILKHPSMSVEHILQLFNTLIMPILLFNCEIWGIGNCNTVDKYYIGFLKNILRVKSSTNNCMIYAETGCYPLSVHIETLLVKYWLKIIQSDEDTFLRLIYNAMQETLIHVPNQPNWVKEVQTLLYKRGFGYVWLNQHVADKKQFLAIFEQRCKDAYVQECFSDIANSNRCRLYREIKDTHQIEPYLTSIISCNLRTSFTKLRLSSHRLMVERGRWMKPKVEFVDRKCTLCDVGDIEDEYHILMRCAILRTLRQKYVKN